MHAMVLKRVGAALEWTNLADRLARLVQLSAAVGLEPCLQQRGGAVDLLCRNSG
jgi:hypothetical protein